MKRSLWQRYLQHGQLMPPIHCSSYHVLMSVCSLCIHTASTLAWLHSALRALQQRASRAKLAPLCMLLFLLLAGLRLPRRHIACFMGSTHGMGRTLDSSSTGEAGTAAEAMSGKAEPAAGAAEPGTKASKSSGSGGRSSRGK